MIPLFKKAWVKVLNPIAKVIRFKTDSGKRSQRKLVMTLVVRNEDDILRENIEHHFSQGVDYIIATDHASTDDTGAILAEYARQGRLHLIKEAGESYRKEEWVNRMADLAFDKFGPCFIFHCDGDEFWQSITGNLKDELIQHPLSGYLVVPVRNIMLRYRSFNERFPEDAVYSVAKPFPADNLMNASRERSLYLFVHPPKLIYRADSFMPHVTMGNHSLKDGQRMVRMKARSIKVFHFPIRGYEHFNRKTVEGGASIAANVSLEKNVSWHKRRWYAQYQAGDVNSAYRMHLLEENEAADMVRQGILEVNEDSWFSQFLSIHKGESPSISGMENIKSE